MTNQRLAAAQEWLWRRNHDNALATGTARIARYVVMLGRDIADGHLSLRAMSLVYTTLLSLVPLLALGFSMFKALGVHNALEPALRQFMDPLGERADELVIAILDFVENIQVGVLGSLGIGLLLYAAVSLIQKVESSFNWIWHIKHPRSLGARFSEYLSVLIVGPFAVFLSVGITASALNSSVVQTIAEVEPFGMLIVGLARLVPYILIVGVFSFLYAFIPNTRVPLRAAIGGGIFAGVLWQSASMAFATFVASAGNYNAIYSSFAIVIFLLIWLYLGWLILMLGCRLSFYIAHPERVRREAEEPASAPRAIERVGLALVREITRRHLAGETHATRPELARLVLTPADRVDPVVDQLIAEGVLAESNEQPSRILLARSADGITLGELWKILRRGGIEGSFANVPGSHLQAAQDTVQTAEAAFSDDEGSISLRDWLQDPPPSR